MDTTDDYYTANPEQRARMLAKNTPPAAQTHRGKPAAWTMRGYLDAVKPGRTPTHRADGPPTIPARYALLTTNGKANTND